MDKTLFKEILEKTEKRIINIDNFWEFEEFNKFMISLKEDIIKMPYYTLTGRFEELLFDILKNPTDFNYNYDLLLCQLLESMKKLIVPCLIILPLNFIYDTVNNSYDISECLKIFKKESEKEKKLFLSPLEKYVSRTIYANLCKEHIFTTKDKNFFNYDILTIKINNVAAHCVETSKDITTAVYSIIRMLDYDSSKSFNLSAITNRPLASTYCVYYNEPSTSAKPPYNNGYGYSLRNNFSSALDINKKEFFGKIDLFRDLVECFLSFTFYDQNEMSDKYNLNIAKWKNSIKLFNDAYEFASKEKYDTANVILVLILESLFLKNEGIKKQDRLTKAVVEYCSDILKEYDVECIVSDAYKKRNAYVHEAKTIVRNNVKSLSSVQGIFNGMKPFTNSNLCIDYEDEEMLNYLFRIVIYVLIKKSNELMLYLKKNNVCKYY